MSGSPRSPLSPRSRALGFVLALTGVGACGGGRIFTTLEAEDELAGLSCDPNPCGNGGTCAQDASGHVTCTCPPGFSGPRCAPEGDDCAPNPCQNGGMCDEAPGAGTFTCVCPPGYAGPRCETNIDDCAPNPCLNGGTCNDGLSTFTCTCASGFTGPLCATVVDDCTPNPCLNGGTCADQPGAGTFTCTCPNGFTGPLCATNVDDCAPNPCLNGGTCVDGTASFTCTCPNGFSGPLCATNIDECSPNPCLNGGTCTDGTASFTCACPQRYTGTTCATDRCVSGAVATIANGPSCMGLAANCGSAVENCCIAPLVLGNATGSRCEGATFYRDYDDAPGLFDTKVRPAQVSDFYFDKFDVTVGRFKNFVAAFDAWRTAGNPATGGGAHPKIAGSGWDAAWPLAADATALKTALKTGAGFQTWPNDDVSTTNDLRPITTQNWYEAFAFCHWEGGRLATEAEMVYATLGGSEQRSYPWSAPASDLTISSTHASYGCTGNGVAGCQNDDLVPVGTFPLGNGRWTHADLVGNTWQWGFDVWSSTPASNGPDNLCTNCGLATGGTQRTIRGGHSASVANDLRGPARGFQQATSRGGHTFRCAYDVQ